MTKRYPCHDVYCTLANGTEVLTNSVQGLSVERDYANMCLRPLTKAEQAEVDQIMEDKAFADECERDKVASSQQTHLW